MNSWWSCELPSLNRWPSTWPSNQWCPAFALDTHFQTPTSSFWLFFVYLMLYIVDHGFVEGAWYTLFSSWDKWLLDMISELRLGLGGELLASSLSVCFCFHLLSISLMYGLGSFASPRVRQGCMWGRALESLKYNWRPFSYFKLLGQLLTLHTLFHVMIIQLTRTSLLIYLHV